jgi:hypothetical protein
MNDPLTKPSRLNRRRKKRWKITDLIKLGLTDCYRLANLSPLSQKTKVGSRSPDNGHNRPLYTVVFLCPPKTQSALCRLFSIMAGYFRQPLKKAGRFRYRYCEPDLFRHPTFRSNGRRLFLI